MWVEIAKVCLVSWSQNAFALNLTLGGKLSLPASLKSESSGSVWIMKNSLNWNQNVIVWRLKLWPGSNSCVTKRKSILSSSSWLASILSPRLSLVRLGDDQGFLVPPPPTDPNEMTLFSSFICFVCLQGQWSQLYSASEFPSLRVNPAQVPHVLFIYCLAQKKWIDWRRP